MRAIRVLRYMAVMVLLSGCIERYYPESDDILTGTLVINASLSSLPGIQTIQISRSDGLLYPEFIPESNCLVVVESQGEEQLEFSEMTPGYYSADVPEGYMRFGDQYRLRVVNSSGKIYLSDYSRLHAPTEIDRIYYEVENHPTVDPEVFVHGIRFYIDFQVDVGKSEFMRWELLETYEFHNPPYQGYIYSYDRVLRPLPDSLDDRQCWITEHVNSIFTMDVANTTSASYTRMPLQYVSNETQRLNHGYSLLVRQHSMDESSFRYWDELKKNSYNQSGLYDRLPSLTPSNISNMDDPEEKVLGFFGVSGLTEKRIFVKEVEGLQKYEVLFCLPYPEMPRFRFLMTADLPVYLSRASDPVTGSAIFGETILECLDCRVRKGSSGDPPEFWPTE